MREMSLVVDLSSIHSVLVIRTLVIRTDGIPRYPDKMLFSPDNEDPLAVQSSPRYPDWSPVNEEWNDLI